MSACAALIAMLVALLTGGSPAATAPGAGTAPAQTSSSAASSSSANAH